MKISSFKKTAKQKLENNWGIAIGSMLLVVLISSGAASVGQFVLKSSPYLGAAFSFASLLVAPIAIGYNRIHMDLSIDKVPQIETVFDGFKNGKFGNNFLALLLVQLFVLFWCLLFIIPGIIKMFSYAMTPFILADPEYDGIQPVDAITKSREMMNGHKMDLFILILSFIGWIILIPLTFGLLFLYVGPYVQQATTEFYFEVKGGKPEETKVKMNTIDDDLVYQ